METIAPSGLVVRDAARAAAAHLLRRTTLTVDPERIDDFAAAGWDDAVSTLLDEAVAPPEGTPPATDDWGDTIEWWLDRMVDPAGGLRERMAWFWHTHLTTSADKVSENELIAEQLDGLRVNALGGYRTLLFEYLTSGALLEYLDASGSVASNPNENLARELMELFTLGRGNYDQDDVRSAARALAGWVVEDGRVEWRRERGFLAPLLFRGVQDDWDTAKIVDHLCDQPETAVTVGARVWADLVGDPLGGDDAAELGRWWQDRDLDIAALVGRILTEPVFRQRRLNRPRSGLEWYVAFRSVTGAEADGPWETERLGQMPYQPPNVGGWPGGRRWVAPGSIMTRAAMSFGIDRDSIGGGRSGTVDEILDRCGLHEVGEATLSAIDGVRSSDALPPEVAYLTRWRIALASPEFSLS